MILQSPITITQSMISGYNVTQDVPTWNSLTTYAKDEKVIVDGCGCVVYQSLENNNIGNNPTLTLGTKWVKAGVSNYTAMFDGSNSTQTVEPNLIEFNLTLGSVFSGCTIINVQAQSVEITVTDPALGELYNETHELFIHKSTNHYDWFFTVPTQIERISIDGLPPAPNATVNVKLRNEGLDVKVGLIEFGYHYFIGDCEWGGVKPELKSFSLINEDPFGNIDIVKRLKKRDASYQVSVPTGQLDEVISLIERFQDDPAVFIGTGDYQGSIVRGIVESFTPSYNSLTQSAYTLKIKGYT